ncbi:acyl-CoA dehydrogenase family protein [Alicyclobacillus sp. ALC3]|uniref:acyl-CoA dehydrogenase family protein n=1 Tax=Alicyclobacillus sp. ALC3 TaxID=2796143 RepID=UPI0023783F7C|nr:acyl-CoA dehydrogenase family protein [Alicyclobacillus sp. ALC3]WDL95848.1 acyl-CoA/acyl-ACP dehydrogenase [Alicyclobacillus sp. ALC3]
MISFRPTEEEKQFMDVASDFAMEIRAAARDCEEAGRPSDTLVKKAEELGFTVMELPESADGLELPLVSQAQILESLCFGDLGVVQGFPGPADADSLLRTAAAAGLDKLGTGFGTAPSAFVDALQGQSLPKETLRLETANGGYRLFGTSRPARGVQFAQRLFVAVADDAGQQAVVVLNQPGDGSTAWRVVEGDIRLGLLTAGVARVAFEDVEIPDEAVVAIGDSAAQWLTAARARIQVLQAARSVGAMQAAVDYVTMYTAGRKAFGQAIAKFQGVSFTVADMAIETAAARNLVLYAAAQIDAGEDGGAQSARLAAARASRSLRFVTSNGVQLLGGHGFVQDYPVEKWMRDGQAQAVLYGRETERLIEYGEVLLGKGGASA